MNYVNECDKIIYTTIDKNPGRMTHIHDIYHNSEFKSGFAYFAYRIEYCEKFDRTLRIEGMVIDIKL